MKIQALAIIAIMIILPMTIILNEYSKSQIKTLQLQVQYDSKLDNATYDAIKTFQLNMTNSDSSDIANSKIRDIMSSINVFFTSLASNYNMSGYGKEVLQNYVPAVVYTLYDGYYIYSDYTNTLEPEDSNKISTEATYQDGIELYGLKPYIYYSCRYIKGSNVDVTITYSLDSYITIQGIVNNEAVNESGYLLTGVDKIGDDYYYKGVKIVEEIDKEGLKQNIFVDGDQTGQGKNRIEVNVDGEQHFGSILNYSCKKINGVKYYYEEGSGKSIAILNGKKLEQQNVNHINENRNAIQFYKDAYEFKNKILSGDLSYLNSLSSGDAVDIKGDPYSNLGDNNPYSGDYSIFKNLGNNEKDGPFIEDENSDFNAHRLQVIKNSIESNLIPAISNFNKISTSNVNFQMPKLNDEEWERITQNISMITFLQGLNIGGKIYNGHSIISNNNNEDFVSEDSIYIVSDNGEYHRVTDSDFNIDDNSIGIYSTDFQRRASECGPDDNATRVYYYPKEELACYNSIVNSNSVYNSKSINDYLKNAYANPNSKIYQIAQLYYTALGRERYGMYRVMNRLEDVQEMLLNGELQD